jgi:hypothetical protein
MQHQELDVNDTIRAGVLCLHELENCGDSVSPDDAFTLLYLSSETRKRAVRVFRQSLYVWRREAGLALRRARASAMESGQWMRWSWLTWIQYSIPFRYYSLVLLTACGCTPYPTFLLAVQQTSSLTNLGGGPVHR